MPHSPLKKSLLAALLVSLPMLTQAQAQAPAGKCPGPLSPLRVDGSGHFLVTDTGKPFFWLGDTAWELIHSLSQDEIDYYLTTRASQSYTVIQTVVLAEFDGLTRPTPEGWVPFVDMDPSRPNSAYFDKVAKTVERARELGLYVALLPSWGDKITYPWGAGPRLFTLDRLDVARAYGKYLGQRLKAYPNVIWMMGGDRPSRVDARSNEYAQRTAREAGWTVPIDWTPVWTAMVEGIREGYGSRALFSYHPMGGPDGTALDLPDVPWLAINGRQSGHGGGHDVPIWDAIARDYSLKKPTLDLEPNYEDHPYNPWPSWDPASGYFDDYDVRKQVYRSVFAGAAGVTYGHHAVWQFAGGTRAGINHANMDWMTALHRPAARQMRYLRALIESRPYLSRIPDDSLITKGLGETYSRMVATRASDGSFAMIYFPLSNQRASISLERLTVAKFRTWWYDPRLGVAREFAAKPQDQLLPLQSPPNGPDWVLVIDDAGRGFRPPGITR